MDNLARPVVRVYWLRGVLGLAAGAVIAWVTAIPLLAVAGVVGGLVLPVLLGNPPARDIDLLQALDRWIRGLTATLTSGRSIADSIRFSAKGAPALLAEPLALLVARLDARWTVEQALRAMADDLDSPDADAVLASLMLASQRGGTGGATTLTALADNVQERLKALREIEAERAKPRIVVRQVTGITLVVLGLALVFGRSFFAPYGTALGQVILALLLAAYLGSLLALRRLTAPRQRARILRRADS